jgi:RNA polymerase-binding transcription factor
VKKPAAKKTSRKVAAPPSRARPAAKKTAPRPTPVNAKTTASKKAVTPAKKATPVAKKTAPAKAAAPTKKPPPRVPAGRSGVPARAAAPAAKAAAGRVDASAKNSSASAKAAAAKLAPAPKPTPTGKAHGAAQPAPAPVAAAAATGAPLAMPNGFVPRKPGRGTPKYFVAPVQAPLPPPTSRFADRFAPPRPPTRQMNKQEHDTPRHAHKADPKLANAWKTKAGRDLSDDELLAMPESEYMNEKQLEFFRMKLQALKDDLLSNAGETTEHLREDTSIVPDPADRATIEEEHALELRTRDRERKLLKKISQSLGRIESGEYGFCDETGEPIGLGRLIARPTATLSLEAQQRRELKQKMFGD